LVDDAGQGVHGSDGDDLVGSVDRGGEHTEGAQTGIAAGFESEVVGEPHRVDDAWGAGECVQGGLDPHMPSFL
jgi:hypothetical protein